MPASNGGVASRMLKTEKALSKMQRRRLDTTPLSGAGMTKEGMGAEMTKYSIKKKIRP